MPLQPRIFNDLAKLFMTKLNDLTPFVSMSMSCEFGLQVSALQVFKATGGGIGVYLWDANSKRDEMEESKALR